MTADRLQSDPDPYYARHVFCCTNRRPDGHARGSCAAKGSEGLRDYMKARAKELGLTDMRINSAGCLDRCELGPTIVIYPEGVWYTVHSREDVDAILDAHLKTGGRVDRLMLSKEQTALRPDQTGVAPAADPAADPAAEPAAIAGPA